MKAIKNIIKLLIPFYNSYLKSASTPVHNQSFGNYLKFRIIGKCGKLGGVLSNSSNVYNSQYAKNLCRN